jgi:Domain of unknown function (DUF4062)
MSPTEIPYEDPSAPRWKVFISSTSQGLEGYRAAAQDVIEHFTITGRKCFEPVGMEDFGARANQARDVCVREVQKCDLLVGIVGVRYGSHPRGDTTATSYTETEFHAAGQRRISRLMFVLDEDSATTLELKKPQTAGQAERQRMFRDRVTEATVCGMGLTSEAEFRDELEQALAKWVEEDSFSAAMVDHAAVFHQARDRLLSLAGTGGPMLVFGEPGTGKSTLIQVLLGDMLVRRSYARLASPPVTVQLSGGPDTIEQARAAVCARLLSPADQLAAGPVPDSPRALWPVLGSSPVLIALDLQTGDADEVVDPDTLAALDSLFNWDPLRATVIAETNNHSVKDHFAQAPQWPRDAVVTVTDYETVDDALEQLRRDAPEVASWPKGATTLVEALGLRPMSVFDVAAYINKSSGGVSGAVSKLVGQQLATIASEPSPEGRYDKLIRNHLDHLSTGARELLAFMTVLHPKPTLFPDQLALALDPTLTKDVAIRLATADEDDEDDDDDDDDDDENSDAQEAHRVDMLVAELVGRGLLERSPRIRPAQWPASGPAPDPAARSAEPLTLHSTKRKIIQDYLPLSPEQCTEGHARAEAFYRAKIGAAVMDSFSERFRMEDDLWWDDVEEWLYHLGDTESERASVSFATLFFNAFWWWDVYVESGFCESLLAYGRRPLVQAISREMRVVIRLLTKFHGIYPREYKTSRQQVLAGIAGIDPVRDENVREINRAGAGVIDVLRELCGKLGITDLDALFTDRLDAVPAEPEVDEHRLHLLGLMCLFLADGHLYRAAEEPDGRALETAERCYRQAETYFQAERDSWDLAWTHYLLGVVTARRSGSTAEWAAATDEADEQGDTELLANIERVCADHLRAQGNLDEALTHYGRALFYALTLQITSNVEAGADHYTQSFYDEIRLRAVQAFAEPLYRVEGQDPENRAEAERRLWLLLKPWGGSWAPDRGAVAKALRSASRDDVAGTAERISAAMFPPGPEDEVLGRPDDDYHRRVRNIVEQTRTQPWVRGLGSVDRWDDVRKERERLQRKKV